MTEELTVRRANAFNRRRATLVALAVILVGAAIVGFVVSRDDASTDVTTAPGPAASIPSAEDLLQIAQAQVVGGAPNSQLVPTVVPPGMEVVAVQDAPADPIVGGGLRVSVYGRAQDEQPLRGPVLAAIESTSPLKGLPGSDAVTIRGLRAQQRTRGGSTTIRWDLQDAERSAAVYGRNLTATQVKAAAKAIDLGQKVEIPETGRPTGVSEISTGDPWRSDSEWVGSALLHGSVVRYQRESDAATIELSIAGGDDRLRTLALTAVDAAPTSQVRGQEAARGPLTLDDDASAIATVWSEGGDVIVVTARGISTAELDAFIASLRPALPAEWDLLREQASNQEPEEDDRGTIGLLAGDAPDGRWEWTLTGRATSFRLRDSDGSLEGGDDSISPNTPDGSIPSLYGVLRYPIGGGTAFIGGFLNRSVQRIEIEYADGSRAQAEIKDAGSQYEMLFFGAATKSEGLRSVIAFDGEANELDRIEF